MRAVVFAGPSLPPAVRPVDPRIAWRPPACRGDVYRAALERPDAIGLIDGYFDAVPSVWHKEILWAMDQGIRVYGAASIGALRAVELADFGMIGVGHVYQAYRDGTLVDDDEVALLHGPEETGYVQITEAMVNVRMTIEEAVRVGIVASHVGAVLMSVAKSLTYKRRTYCAVLGAAQRQGLPMPQLRNLDEWLQVGRVDRKREDAQAMATAITSYPTACPSRPAVSFRLNHTAAWNHVCGRG